MKTNIHISRVVMILAVLFAFFSWSALVTAGSLADTAGIIHYVKPDVTTGTCADWENACDLQTALGLAEAGDEIWVAEGVHYPGSGSDPRTVTFQLESGVEIYGGFDGMETQRDERDWDAHPTILSGDLDRDGVKDEVNAYHVVTSNGEDETAVLDGFTITGGNADSSSDPDDAGGGMRIDYGSPTLRNLNFIDNFAGVYGGGMVVAFSSPSLTNVVFINNTATNGGGIYNWISTPTLLDVIFISNSATNGGGMDNRNGSDATLTNVVFSGNSASANGGGMYNDDSIPTLTNVTFSSNSAGSGGGMYNHYPSSPTLTNVIVWGNSPDQLYNEVFCSMYINYSDIQGGCPAWATCTQVINTDPLFVDPDNGNLRLGRTSPAIDAGDNAALPAEVTTDLDGSPRKVDIDDVIDTGNGTSPIVDMGAYEVQEGADVIYVDRDAPGPLHDGQSWASAFNEVQSGLAAAQEGNEIWVAEGTYYPGVIGNRNATFGLKSGVEIYGGFVGTETQRDERDWDAHLTVLSGDLDRDGTLDDGNAYQVVNGSGVDDTAVLDSFTINGGNANGTYPQDRGGGMYTGTGSPTLTNLTFSGNFADHGGGMYNDTGSPTMTNISFTSNLADHGGGMNIMSGSPTLINVIFTGNSAYYEGGGMYNGIGSPTLVNTTFSGNTADFNYGGIYNMGGNLTLINAIMWGNSPIENQISNEFGFVNISYSDIQGGYTGMGNIDTDPLFVDAANGNLRLGQSSPAVDAGDNTAVPEDVTTDLDGSPRIVGDTVDMGAYEVQAGAEIIYVDRDAPGPVHDGQSWASAFSGVQSGLAAAQEGNEIWVAEGTYYPGVIGNRSATFQLKSGVEMYGGFAGTETQRDDRDWDAHPTVLSGDIDRDDILDDGNAYHVVTGSGVDETAILDGFTITGGNADEISLYRYFGGGMYNETGNPTLTNINFLNNSAYSGGGVFNDTSSPTLTNVNFSGNSATYGGGGMYNSSNSKPTMTNVTFSGNSSGDGGGMVNSSNSKPTMTNIIFSSNSATYSGGGMVNSSNSNPTMTNVTFTGNSAGYPGGGMYNLFSNPTLTNVTFTGNYADEGGGMVNFYSNPTLTNVSFSNNSAGAYGGGMCNYSSTPKLTNSIVWGNAPDQIYNDPDSTADISYSDIQGGYTGTGNIDFDPLFVDPDNGDLHLQETSPAIDAGDNTAVPVDVTTDLDGNPRFVDILEIPDTGSGNPPIVDMGAYEVQPELNSLYLPLIWK